MKILMVDDSKAVHSFIKDLFKNDPIEFESAYDGQEAVEMIAKGQNSYDVIFLDWEMPKKTGSEVLGEIRAKGIEVPVIMVTTKSAMEHVEEVLTKGANEYVMKPFTRDILAEKLLMVTGEDFLQTPQAA